MYIKESKQLKLKVREQSTTLSSRQKSLMVHLQVINVTNRGLRLLGFYDEIKDFIYEPDSLWTYGIPGISLEMFNDKGAKYFPDAYSVFTKEMYDEIMNVESVDSLIVSTKKQYGDFENWEVEEKKRILANEKWLQPGESIEIILNISFQGFFLNKGKYDLVIYYLVNEKIYKYVNKKKDDFLGWVKSNKVQLLVE
jgi:hypothetical protein